MAEPPPGTQVLRLRDDFPPVPTSEWEAAIRSDLKGADYDKKLVWRTDEGIAVRSYYRREDLAGSIPRPVPAPEGWDIDQDWAEPAGAVRADYLHEAGATAIQELGYGLAMAVEHIEAAGSTRPPVTFVYAAGSNYFMEIAKLRAARLLWQNVLGAYGEATEGTHVHVRTERLNKSTCDPWTNLLRVTTEALSAVVGGCDSLTVEPFGFSEHLASGVQRILQEESHLGKVSDPAAGSYFIEALTDALARNAWDLFQRVEAQGGWSAALSSGSVEKELEASRARKVAAVATRRRTLVGVNNYPDLREKEGPGTAPAPFANDAFSQSRLAEPFEHIRARTEAYARQTGRYPVVVLLKRGDLRMRMARANFCINFFGCAGFDIVEADELGAPGDLVVLCSSDAEYLDFARDVCSRVAAPVLVAGNPRDGIEKLEALGVQGFVHVQSNAAETLTEWQRRLGMRD